MFYLQVHSIHYLLYCNKLTSISKIQLAPVCSMQRYDTAVTVTFQVFHFISMQVLVVSTVTFIDAFGKEKL